MNLSAVDLNLLLVLQTVLQERSATRAAQKLHVTQSAVSNALARLREIFKDPLVVRSGRGLVPTPWATEIEPLLNRGLDQLRALLEKDSGFDPARTTRQFTVATPHHVEVVLLPPLMRLFARRFPMASLRVVTVEYAISTDGVAKGEIDILLGAPPVLPVGCEAEPLFFEQRVCAVWKKNPLLRTRGRGPFQLDDFLRLKHVQVALQGTTPIDGVDAALYGRGLTRNIALSVPHYTTAAMAVVETDLVATLPLQLAHNLARTWPLRMIEPPLELRGSTISQIWHLRTTQDPGVTVLRQLMKAAVKQSGLQTTPTRRSKAAEKRPTEKKGT